MGVLRQSGASPGFRLGSRCLLGRHAGCDLRLDNPRISGEHASLHWACDHWELKDLGSRNGTFVAGRKLQPGERTVLQRGATFLLGTDVELTLEDAAPPVASARHVKTARLRTASEGLLVLPDDDHPEVTIFEGAHGRWTAEEGDRTRLVADRDIVIADGEGWILDLPSPVNSTWEAGSLPPTLDSIRLCFTVSRDEERITLSVWHAGQVTELTPRSYHYLLLTLAREMLDDEEAEPAERGWLEREHLCDMLGVDPSRLNVDVFRARRQLSELGIQGAANLVERRAGSGQLRLGTAHVEITRL